MVRLALFAAFAALTLSSAPVGANTGAANVTGLWMTQKKGIVIDLYECGQRLCGRTVWLKRMTNKDGSPRLDAKNPDPAKRDRHWCGIEVINRLSPKGGAKWEGGKVYDPKTGLYFDFELRARDDGKLKVRGYKGVKMLGKSEVWTRADDVDVEFCAKPRA